MATSYLFAYYTLDSQVSLSSCMSIKTGLFFFLTFCYIINPISGIYDRSLLHYGKLGEKIGRKKEQYTLEIRKIVRTASLGSNFTGSYKKNCTDVKYKK